MNDKVNIVVAGAGAFGTALAIALTANDAADVHLLARDDETAAEINKARMNQKRLPGVLLPESLNITADLKCLKEADIILSVVPSASQLAFIQSAKEFLSENCSIVICSKGFEPENGGLISDNIQNVTGLRKVAVLSGPGFASDIAQGLPTAMTLACNELAMAEYLSEKLSRSNFRLYASADPIGVQVGGRVEKYSGNCGGDRLWCRTWRKCSCFCYCTRPCGNIALY